MENRIFSSPFDLVAKALDCKVETLTEESCMLNHPKWESLSHVAIIDAIETNYGIPIPDQDVMKYDNMKAIIALYEQLTSRS